MGSYANETVSAGASAIGFTDSLISMPTMWGLECKSVTVTCETNPCRFTTDGTTPTSSVGHNLSAGDSLVVKGADIGKFLAIKVTATSTLICTFCDVVDS